MILILSDTHSFYNIINERIEYTENVLGIPVSFVIHLGEFGIFRYELKKYFNKDKKRFLRPVYFIEGNHEDFTLFEELVKKYSDFFTHLPRCSVRSIDSYRMLALGGAAYMDSFITQTGALITDHNINDCLSIPCDDVDIVLTHDCPIGIGMPNSPGLEYYGKTGFKRGDELASHFKPKIWLFGHHHKWFESKINGTRYYGLPESWKGFGLLDKDFQFRFVKHSVEIKERKRSFIERFFVKCKIIR